LLEIPGIGKWTAQYIAMRALGDPDAFPSGDLGLLRGSGLASFRELEEHAEVWRPWCAYGAIYLWSMAARAQLREAEHAPFSLPNATIPASDVQVTARVP